MRLLFVCLFVGVLRLPWFRFESGVKQSYRAAGAWIPAGSPSYPGGGASRSRRWSFEPLWPPGWGSRLPVSSGSFPLLRKNTNSLHTVLVTRGGKAHSMFESMFLVYANWLTVTVYVGVSVCVCASNISSPPSPESRNLSWVWGSKVVFLSAVCHRDASIAAGKD